MPSLEDIAPHYSLSALLGRLQLGAKDVLNSTDTYMALQDTGVGMTEERDLRVWHPPTPSWGATENHPAKSHHSLGPAAALEATHSFFIK